MSGVSNWRLVSAEETHVIRAVLTRGGDDGLLVDLASARVRNETAWILDIEVTGDGARCDLPDGPYPVRAFITTAEKYRGEIIVWLAGGQVSGLEYAWVSDEPPTRWPSPDEMDVVAG